jgi:hypothetical protein
MLGPQHNLAQKEKRKKNRETKKKKEKKVMPRWSGRRKR